MEELEFYRYEIELLVQESSVTTYAYRLLTDDPHRAIDKKTMDSIVRDIIRNPNHSQVTYTSRSDTHVTYEYQTTGVYTVVSTTQGITDLSGKIVDVQNIDVDADFVPLTMSPRKVLTIKF